jgi:hypothetical protein
VRKESFNVRKRKRITYSTGREEDPCQQKEKKRGELGLF